MRKKVLILSEAFGSGHTKAAEALAQNVSLHEPSVQTQIIEIGRMLHPINSQLILRAYKQIIATCPSLWKKIYYYLTIPNQTVPYWLQFMIYHLFHRNIEKVLDQIQPDLVICTHRSSPYLCVNSPSVRIPLPSPEGGDAGSTPPAPRHSPCGSPSKGLLDLSKVC